MESIQIRPGILHPFIHFIIHVDVRKRNTVYLLASYGMFQCSNFEYSNVRICLSNTHTHIHYEHTRRKCQYRSIQLGLRCLSLWDNGHIVICCGAGVIAIRKQNVVRVSYTPFTCGMTHVLVQNQIRIQTQYNIVH